MQFSFSVLFLCLAREFNDIQLVYELNTSLNTPTRIHIGKEREKENVCERGRKRDEIAGLFKWL